MGYVDVDICHMVKAFTGWILRWVFGCQYYDVVVVEYIKGSKDHGHEKKVFQKEDMYNM